MVLTDDNFATIEAAVEEGRGVFDNLTKFIVWTLPTNMGEGLRDPRRRSCSASALPILPVQILWINMTTAVVLGLMLAFEPKEAGIMARPPRDPRQPLLTGSLHVRIAAGRQRCSFVGALVALRMGTVERCGVSTRRAPRHSTCSSPSRPSTSSAAGRFAYSAWRIGVFSNRWILGGVALQIVGQLAITYFPPMQQVFQTTAISPGAWIRIWLVASIAAGTVSVDKLFHRNERAGGGV